MPQAQLRTALSLDEASECDRSMNLERNQWEEVVGAVEEIWLEDAPKGGARGMLWGRIRTSPEGSAFGQPQWTGQRFKQPGETSFLVGCLGEGVSEMISEKVGRLKLQLMGLLRYLQHFKDTQHYS